MPAWGEVPSIKFQEPKEMREAAEKPVLLKGMASAVPQVHCSQNGFSR
jgi:hypothetical protein